MHETSQKLSLCLVNRRRPMAGIPPTFDADFFYGVPTKRRIILLAKNEYDQNGENLFFCG